MMVIPGIERLVVERPELVRDRRVGLLAHPASVDRHLRHAVELLKGAGARIERLFAPEHGAGGSLQDMVASHELLDPVTGLPVVSLYGDCEESLTPSEQAFSGLDLLVADLADVGSRYYTFAATVIRCLEGAGRLGVQVVVCDRPNPLGGVVIEGNIVREPQRSFVGELPVANRHGMTLGELCLFAVEQRQLDVDLTVIEVSGWSREEWFDQTGLPWVLPSPNMPILETAIVYPGTCLVEGTNLSEGRGTTRPFELIGAPWLENTRLAQALETEELPGVCFRPVSFLPAFQKFAGQECGGVQLHVTDRELFRPVLTGLALLIHARRLAPEFFDWRREEYEFVSDQLAIDLLAGTPAWREAIEAGSGPWEIAATWTLEMADFQEKRSPSLRYGVGS